MDYYDIYMPMWIHNHCKKYLVVGLQDWRHTSTCMLRAKRDMVLDKKNRHKFYWVPFWCLFCSSTCISLPSSKGAPNCEATFKPSSPWKITSAPFSTFWSMVWMKQKSGRSWDVGVLNFDWARENEPQYNYYSLSPQNGVTFAWHVRTFPLRLMGPGLPLFLSEDFANHVHYHCGNHTAARELLVHLPSDISRYCRFGETLLTPSRVIDMSRYTYIRIYAVATFYHVYNKSGLL